MASDSDLTNILGAPQEKSPPPTNQEIDEALLLEDLQELGIPLLTSNLENIEALLEDAEGCGDVPERTVATQKPMDEQEARDEEAPIMDPEALYNFIRNDLSMQESQPNNSLAVPTSNPISEAHFNLLRCDLPRQESTLALGTQPETSATVSESTESSSNPGEAHFNHLCGHLSRQESTLALGTRPETSVAVSESTTSSSNPGDLYIHLLRNIFPNQDFLSLWSQLQNFIPVFETFSFSMLSALFNIFSLPREESEKIKEILVLSSQLTSSESISPETSINLIQNNKKSNEAINKISAGTQKQNSAVPKTSENFFTQEQIRMVIQLARLINTRQSTSQGSDSDDPTCVFENNKVIAKQLILSLKSFLKDGNGSKSSKEKPEEQNAIVKNIRSLCGQHLAAQGNSNKNQEIEDEPSAAKRRKIDNGGANE